MSKYKKVNRCLALSLALIFILILGGCTPKQSAKAQLGTNTKVILTDIKKQKQSLRTIQAKMTKNQASFSSEQDKFPGENLLDTADSKTYQTVTERREAYEAFKRNQTALQSDRTELLKISNQTYPNMPKQAINDLVQSLHLSALDQKTFVTFMDELTSAEETYYDLLSQDSQAHADSSGTNTASDDDISELEAQENRLNQYYGAVFQQIEIMNVNLNTAQKQARDLKNKVD
ncbi:hypothetical protein ACFQ5M_12670 [Agrilactobacillus yilanensis]|uniref:Lipoprotein n=1 Tax=Agrilactobacillus yilanensis TaxID=2485997 RepID=A0ABW4J9P6_9LACO|nr:hypothetical protein [Agrilactobacillus yilanensis]